HFSLPCFHSIAASPYKYPSMLFLHQLELEFVALLLILLHAIHHFARDRSSKSNRRRPEVVVEETSMAASA
ncbi:hypothetical protein A2U01_0033767, partial [Trifolium medium]|nr:hypothetical protein [Trifolium medium]